MRLTQAQLHYESGLDLPQAQRNLGPTLKLVLYAYFIIFPAAFIYSNSVAQLLGLAKWLPFVILALLLLLKSLKNGQVRADRNATLLLAGTVTTAIISSLASPYGNALFSELVGIAILLLNALMLSALLRRRQAMDRVFDIVLNVGRYIIAISFIMAMLGINLGRGVGRFSGWSDNPNSLGLIIAPAIIVLFARVIEKRHRWKTRYLPFLLAGLVVLFLTESRASIGWVLVSFLTFPVLKIEATSRLLILLFGLTLILLFGDSLFLELGKILFRGDVGANGLEFDALLSGRTDAWGIALKSIAEHPLLGLGVGNDTRLLRDHASQLVIHSGEHLHSSYLSILVVLGILGGVVVGTTLLLAIMRGLRTVRNLRHVQGRSWPTTVLPMAILLGALAHASMETWLLNPGNANSLLFWVLVVYSISGSAAGASTPRPDRRAPSR
jgi:O-antigen ligase